MTEATDTQTTVIEMLKAGETVPSITSATGLTVGEVGAIAHEAGLTREHARELTRAYMEALAWGDRHDSKRIKALAGRARTALDGLVHERQAEAEVAATQEEIAKLRQQLADAEGRLRQAKGKPAAASTSGGTGRSASQPQSKSEREQIRQWARANGHTVADRGRIPATVVDAYRRAHAAGGLRKAG